MKTHAPFTRQRSDQYWGGSVEGGPGEEEVHSNAPPLQGRKLASSRNILQGIHTHNTFLWEPSAHRHTAVHDYLFVNLKIHSNLKNAQREATKKGECDIVTIYCTFIKCSLYSNHWCSKPFQRFTPQISIL